MENTFNIQIKAIRNVLVASVLIMFLKFIAFFITHSNAILSDALESIINVVAGLFAYFSMRYAARPKDINHPYGHGKIEFISAGFEGGLILIAGILIITKAIYSFIFPVEIDHLDKGALLAGFAGIVNFFLGRYLIKTGERYRSITLVADGKHLQSDTLSSVGLIIGIVIIYFTKMVWLDNILAIAFALIIIFTGFKLIRKALAGLMDEADEVIIKDVLKVLSENRREQWIDVHNLRTQQYGSSFHIDCHMTLPWYNSLQDTHEELKKVDELIVKKFHDKVELFIHADPCLPESCSICQLNHCKERTSPFIQKIEWTYTNMVNNEKHQLKNLT